MNFLVAERLLEFMCDVIGNCDVWLIIRKHYNFENIIVIPLIVLVKWQKNEFFIMEDV